MKPTHTLIIFLIFSFFSCKNGINESFNGTNKIEVISYKTECDCDSTKNSMIASKEPSDPKCIEERIILENDKIQEAEEILFENAALDEECRQHMCYSPRHSVIFYENEKRLGYVDICFECLQSRGEEIGCLTDGRVKEIKDYFKKIGITYGL